MNRLARSAIRGTVHRFLVVSANTRTGYRNEKIVSFPQCDWLFWSWIFIRRSKRLGHWTGNSVTRRDGHRITRVSKIGKQRSKRAE